MAAAAGLPELVLVGLSLRKRFLQRSPRVNRITSIAALNGL